MIYFVSIWNTNLIACYIGWNRSPLNTFSNPRKINVLLSLHGWRTLRKPTAWKAVTSTLVWLLEILLCIFQEILLPHLLLSTVLLHLIISKPAAASHPSEFRVFTADTSYQGCFGYVFDCASCSDTHSKCWYISKRPCWMLSDRNVRISCLIKLGDQKYQNKFLW